MTPAITSVAIGHERDIVIARRRACEIARQLHLTVREGTRLGTAVSEIARNALAYAGGGKVEFLLDQEGARSLVVRVSDRGPGIAKPDEVLSGRSRSHSGLGLGIAGARRLVDGFELNSQPGVGTTVVLKKLLNHTASRTEPSPAEIGERVSRKPYDVYDEVQQQNQELTNTLAELSQRQDDLARLNRELEETNRGVVALYAELDERAEHLRQADAMKSRFLSHLSHEFRTPLNGIVGLTRLLLNEPGQSDEAIKQIRYIQRSAEDLTELVNDLLDIAKAEAGKLTVHANQFDVSNVFSALRGVFRALSAGESVALIFDEPESMPVLQTDESKVSQIVRNFISNALKFTERGEVRVSTAYDATRDEVVFSVSDTGIGIAPEHRQRIFEEFAQIDSAVQRRVKGTGLGLPLCKRLAELLGGRVEVSSHVGVGSTFIARIPRQYGVETASRGFERRKLLVIDDEEISRYLLRNLLAGPHEILEASCGREGLQQVIELKPDMVFLDLTMPDMDGVEVLNRLKADPATSSIPVVVVTAQTLEPDQEREMGRKTVAILSKNALARAAALVVQFAPKITVSAQYVQVS